MKCKDILCKKMVKTSGERGGDKEMTDKWI